MAENTDENGLKQLWMRCFPEDDEAYIEAFFSLTELSQQCCCGCLGEQPVTMLFLLPATAKSTKAEWPVRYLYAGCTYPAHRKHGYYGKLMRYAAQKAAEQGSEAIYLHPASDSLFCYYENLGYRPGIQGINRTPPCGALFWNPDDDVVALFSKSKPESIPTAVGDCLWLPTNTVSSLADEMQRCSAYVRWLGD
jgi:hypothetical protein